MLERSLRSHMDRNHMTMSPVAAMDMNSRTDERDARSDTLRRIRGGSKRFVQVFD